MLGETCVSYDVYKKGSRTGVQVELGGGGTHEEQLG
jgi:hypothetical protein